MKPVALALAAFLGVAFGMAANAKTEAEKVRDNIAANAARAKTDRDAQYATVRALRLKVESGAATDADRDAMLLALCDLLEARL